MEILILGHKGLLGNMVKKYFEFSKINVSVINSNIRWNSVEFKEYLLNNKYDFIINCIGAIPQRTKDFSINYTLPIWLSNNVKSKIIHPGTDCEMDTDEYGISKKKSRDYIIDNSENTKIIKTSIIGPELNTHFSLMDWFLSNKDNDEVNGFVNHKWNGNTTLTWAKFCLEIINNWDKYQKETILYSDCVSKYEILNHINDTFGRKIKILKKETDNVDKCLLGEIKMPNIKDQIKELKYFIDEFTN